MDDPTATDFVVGFNPVPMANEVAVSGSRVRRQLVAFLPVVAALAVLWWWQRDRFSPWLLGIAVVVALVTLALTVGRQVSAQRHLVRIGAGPALEAGAQGLALHALDGTTTRLAWDEVTALRTAGLKVAAAGPQLVVDTAAGQAWAMPLSFLDALPGTIDAGVRATSGGRHGLDLSGLDSLF